MISNLTIEFIILAVLIFLSGFFSSSETALVSLNKIKIRQMVDDEVENASLVSKLISKPNKLLGAILIGNNIVNIAASSIATSIAIEIYGSKGIGISTGIMTLLVLIFGEITPKSLAAENAEKTSLRVSKPINIITIILSPFVYILTRVTNVLIRMLGGSTSKTEPLITQDELKTIVSVSREEGVLETDESKMIYNVFDFGDSHAKDIMTPRIDMVALNVEVPYSDLIELFKEETFSRIPIYENDIDDIIGLLHVKDLIFYMNNKDPFDIRDYLRPVLFTYEFKPIQELFREMRDKNYPTAIVLDEYGGTAGMVTTEDLVEEIVGEITDEYDEEEEELLILGENEFLVDGSIRIDLLNELIGTDIESKEFDSMGGFVIGLFGRFPEEKESIEYKNLKFIIEELGKNRIEKMRILK